MSGYDHILLSFDSISVLSGKGGGWLELRSLLVGRILPLHIRLLDFAPATRVRKRIGYLFRRRRRVFPRDALKRASTR